MMDKSQTATKSRFDSVYASIGIKTSRSSNKRFNSEDHQPSDSQAFSNKMSRKDEHLISTMLKIHESVDNTFTRSIKEKEDKELGFN
jgi:hypothetical protein